MPRIVLSLLAMVAAGSAVEARATPLADVAVEAFKKHCSRILMTQPGNITKDKLLLAAGYKPAAEASAAPWPKVLLDQPLSRMTRTVTGGSVTIGTIPQVPYCSVAIYGGTVQPSVESVKTHLYPAFKAVTGTFGGLGFNFKPVPRPVEAINLGPVTLPETGRKATLSGLASMQVADMPSGAAKPPKYSIVTWSVTVGTSLSYYVIESLIGS